MDLVNCPKCQKEIFISDEIEACPCCSFPLVNEVSGGGVDINIKPQKIRPLITIVVVIGAVALIGFFVYKSLSKNNYVSKNLNKDHHIQYISKLGVVMQKILEGSVDAEELTGLTYAVWYNAIHKKFAFRTNKYTMYYRIKNTKYYSMDPGFYDFNSALQLLADDPEIISKKLDLEKICEDVDDIMKILQNPPSELQHRYNDSDKLYRSFASFVEIAVRPSGSLASFTSKINDTRSEFMENYNKLKLHIK